MNLSEIHQNTVLVLNRHWLAIDAITPADAFCHLATDRVRALKIDSVGMEVLDWEQWRVLPAEGEVASIGTPGGRVRLPRVIVLNHYDRVPMVGLSLGFHGLWERDRGRCQYSGRALKRDEANIDHVLPRSRGGAHSWENCVLADRRINQRKADRTPAEAGLQLIRAPRVPKLVPAILRIRNRWKITEWSHFLKLKA